MTPANFILGFGKVNGKQVIVGGEDFTVKGGSPNSAGLRKMRLYRRTSNSI